MKAKPLTLAVLSAALAPGFADAVGLGDMVLLSRIGEPLRAEVPILSGAGDTPETLCFALGSVRNAEFPVVAAAKTRVVQRGRDFRLQIVGSKPIYDPIFVVGLRAGCGADLQRDYVLMPEPPLMVADSPESVPPAAAVVASPPSATRPSSSGGTDWQAREGETLAIIADARSAAKPADRQRLLAAMKRANPQFLADEPLPEGTPVRIPKLKPRQPPQPKPEASPAKSPAADKPAGAIVAAPPASTPPAAPTAATAPPPSDRLVLGAAPEDSRSARPKSPQSATISEMEDRMAQMESTLRLLRMEIEKMDAALLLADKTVEAERKLREAQGVQLAAAAAAQSNATPPASTGVNWLELLLSAAIGGGLAIGIASILGRRRPQPPESLLPPLTAPQAARETSRMDELLETITGTPSAPPPPTPEVRELQEFSDDHAVLALAEVMLSYGRLQGAAETLAEHVREHSPDNILPWSMLLDLYRRGGMRQEFEALAQTIHDKFNVEITSWDSAETPISGLRSLEEYPHIIHRIGETWGTTVGLDYLYDLVHDTRAGQRHGFPLEVVEELTLLIHVQEDAYAIRR